MRLHARNPRRTTRAEPAQNAHAPNARNLVVVVVVVVEVVVVAVVVVVVRNKKFECDDARGTRAEQPAQNNTCGTRAKSKRA